MPYIKQADRSPLDTNIQGLVSHLKRSANFEGELNYTISKIVDGLCDDHQGYAHINRVIGVLECAKLEFYRRAAAEYEDTKIIENGEVYVNVRKHFNIST